MFEVFYLAKLSFPRSRIIICFTVSCRTNQNKTAFKVNMLV